MTFATSEASLAAGRPYELHQFRLGTSSTYWRYADAPVDIDYGGNTFTHVYMKGGRLERGATMLKQRTIVKCDWSNPFAAQYKTYAPDEPVHYTRYKGHGATVQAIFMGDVADVVFRQRSRWGERWAEIAIDPLTAALQRVGLVARYSRQCDVPVYSTRCGVARASHKASGTLDSVSGTTLTSATFGTQADGWWSGGDIVVNSRRRWIVSHSGNNIVIWPGAPDLAAGQAFDVYPGCDHLLTTCDTKFSNLANSPAQPHIPDADPSSQYGWRVG